ncbi:molybdenum cofactor biosynthesis protein B [Rhodoligotrophos appendicifer]
MLTDKSGSLLVERIQSSGHILADRALVLDEVEDIQKQVKNWISTSALDVIITTGGTGLTGRDITPDALKPIFEKIIEGFSIVFHMISYRNIGTSTIQSRAMAGTAGGKLIFCLPGSPGACKDAWDEILAAQLDYRHAPCNFAEILPRLSEHKRQ